MEPSVWDLRQRPYKCIRQPDGATHRPEILAAGGGKLYVLDHVSRTAEDGALEDRPDLRIWDLSARKRLVSPLPAGVTMLAACVDLDSKRIATARCVATATATAPAAQGLQATLWDLDGHRLKEFVFPNCPGSFSDVFIDTPKLAFDRLWWRHGEFHCSWYLSSGQLVPNVAEGQPAGEWEALAGSGRLGQRVWGQAVSPGGTMIAELSSEGLTVWRGTAQEPYEYVRGQPVRGHVVLQERCLQAQT